MEIDLRNPRWYRNTLCELLFPVKKMSKNAISPEYINDCKCEIDFKWQFNKKDNIKWTFYEWNLTYILKRILSKLFVLFYN